MKSRAFKLLIVSLFLIALYFLLISYPYLFSKINRYYSLGFLSIVEEKSEPIERETSSDRVTDQLDNHLLKGEKIKSRIKATENNLGIVLFRFVQLSAKVEDSVTFRIKEEGSKDWYYENEFRADQFQPDEYFTFGFPPITDSKNNTYVFEIESLEGNYENGVGMSLKKPQTAFVYKYSLNDLKDTNKLSFFIFNKLTYAIRNSDFIQNWEILVILLSLLFFMHITKKDNIARLNALVLLNRPKKIFASEKIYILILNKIKSYYLFLRKKGMEFSKKTKHFFKKINRWFISTIIYKYLLSTNSKKRLAIGLSIFLFALTYRFSSSLVNQDKLFYAGLGGQGDYDQFIRAATCAIRNFCPAILGQNFLFESSILGVFYEMFGFAGGLKAYLYLMLVLSSIVATLPYFLLSQKNWISIGGIIGSLFLATSDFLTNMAAILPPDNGSLFTFSMFYIVYFLTLQKANIRWLLLFGLMGTIDGLNKLILLMNDVAVLLLFVPVFLYEKTSKIKKFPFVKFQPKAGPPLAENPKLIFYSILPLLVFLVIYSAWEYIVQIKFSTSYYLRGLITGGSIYASSTDASSVSISESLSKSNIWGILYYYAGSAIVMQRRIIEYAGLNTMLLAPIFFGLLFATFRKPPPEAGWPLAKKYFITKLIAVIIFTVIAFTTLELFRNNYLGIQEIGMYVYAWPKTTYTNLFLFTGIIFLFILNLKYSAIRLLIPILPYYIMLIILTKNAPWGRLWAHVIVWSIILFSFLIDWILTHAKKNYVLKKFFLGPILLSLFIYFYTFPKTSSMVTQLASGIINSRNEVKYLKWVDLELPKEAIILAGGKSDLVTVAQNINRPIIYNSLWTAALLIKPNEIPRVKPTDFTILNDLKINEIPGVTPSDFSIVQELKNKDNFKRNKYIILESDIHIWRNRIAGIDDNVFATASGTLLHPDDYAIKVYKFNSALNKNIYELKLKETGNL